MNIFGKNSTTGKGDPSRFTHNPAPLARASGTRDYVREYTARNLHAILLFCLASFAVITAIGILSGWKATSVICTLGCIATYLLLLLSKAGRINVAGFLTCLLIIVTVNASVLVGEGFRDEATLIYPALIIVASLFLNRTLFILATSISILTFLLIGLGEIHGLIVNELSHMTNYSAVAIAIIILIVTAVAVRLLNRNLFQSIERARASESQVRSLFNSSPSGIILFSMDGVIREVNRPLLEMTGHQPGEILGRQFDDLVAGSNSNDSGGLSAILENSKDRYNSMEAEVIKKDGSTLPVDLRGWVVKDADNAPAAIGAFINDTSIETALSQEKEVLQQQLQQAQKIEAIGTLAGGIAHDFNNILGGMMGYAELAMITPSGDEAKMKRYLGEILKAGDRTKELIGQILKFSRQDAGGLNVVTPTPILKEALKLLRSTLPATIRIKEHIDVDSERILADPTQIHQVVMNLCTNAYHAMGESGGELRVSLEKVRLDKPRSFLNLQVAPGDYLCLTVRDTGQGIPRENLDRIFDPYFTTKKKDQGTGLGLSVTIGIIKSHGGMIDVKSDVRLGTRFRVYLPVTAEELLKKEHHREAVPRGNGERVMVVDDERISLEVMSRFLKSLGYSVTGLGRSREALALFKQDPDAFSAVITDQAMPGLTGNKLALEIKQLNAHIPIILCTGYSEIVTEQSAADFGISTFLMKPVSSRDLGRALHDLLADRSTRATEDRATEDRG